MKYLQIVIAGVASIFLANGANAGSYADDLSQCLVKSTSSQDRDTLVGWFFSATLRHPYVGQLASISSEQRDELNRSMASLLMKLLTDSCRDEAMSTVKYEGTEALGSSFQYLGLVAAESLFDNPDVGSAMSDFKVHLDKDALAKLTDGD